MTTINMKNIPSTLANHFIRDKPGYVTSFLKHANLTLIRSLQDISIFDIPTRLLQSAGNITTSKITAFVEYIFQSISVKF